MGIVAAVVVIAIIAVASTSCYLTSCLTPKPAGTPIKIGVPGPMTGPASTNGEYIKRGVSLAVKTINDEGGILGRPVEAVYSDDQSNIETGVAGIERLITVDKVDVIVGGYHSSLTVAEMDVTAKYGIPWLNPHSSADSIPKKILSDPAKYWAGPFKLCPNSTIYGIMWGAFITDVVNDGTFKPDTKNFGLVVEDSDYGRTVADAIKKNLEAAGWTSIGYEVVAVAQVDFYSVISKFKDSQASLIISTQATTEPKAAYIKQVRELGFKGMLGWVTIAPKIIELAGDAANYGFWAQNIVLIPGPETTKFMKAYNATYGPEKDLQTYASASLDWDGTMMMRDAINKAGSLDPRKIVDALKTSDFRGTCGHYVFGSNYEAKAGPAYVPGGVFEVIKGVNYLVWPLNAALHPIEMPVFSTALFIPQLIPYYSKSPIE
jgi:branched-chain amino acid transport system substrate-binding protein